MTSEYWLISIPKDNGTQETFNAMNDVTNKQQNLCSNYMFTIPELKVGTLDQLVGLSDDLSRLDLFVEQVTRKVATYLGDVLEDKGKLHESLQVNNTNDHSTKNKLNRTKSLTVSKNQVLSVLPMSLSDNTIQMNDFRQSNRNMSTWKIVRWFRSHSDHLCDKLYRKKRHMRVQMQENTHETVELFNETIRNKSSSTLLSSLSSLVWSESSDTSSHSNDDNDMNCITDSESLNDYNKKFEHFNINDSKEYKLKRDSRKRRSILRKFNRGQKFSTVLTGFQ